MFEQENRVGKKREVKEKKSNVYKVVTRIKIAQPDGAHTDPFERTDYVRAKTSAGAVKLIKAQVVSIECTAIVPTQDDLIALAGVAVVGKGG